MHPASAFFSYLLGKNLWVVGRNAEALRHLTSAWNEWDGADRIEWVEIALVNAYSSLGEHEQAEHWYRAAVRSKPADTAPVIYLMGFLARRERFAEACEMAGAALSRGVHGDVDELYLNLGKSRRALGEFDEARACFARAVELSPDYTLALAALADVDEAIRLKKTFGANRKSDSRRRRPRPATPAAPPG